MQFDKIFDIFKDIEPIKNHEFISLLESTNRILFEDIIASKSLPGFDNAALDGYAFNYDDIKNPLKINGTILAGDKTNYKIEKNECYKIMTGAIFPDNSNTIVMFEDEKFDEKGYLLVPHNIKKDNARKLKGEEVKVGEILLKKGELLTPSKVMLLASQGISYVKVYSRLKIALFSSGNEVNEPWQDCDEKGIYNANAFGLYSMLNKFGFRSQYKGILHDDKEILKTELNKLSNYDVIITSGGASKGESDFMKKVLLEIGFNPIFDGLEAKPVKPTKLFKKDNQFIFVLPGNPMSCFLSCFLSCIPALKKFNGLKDYKHEGIKGNFKGNLELKANRIDIVIGNYKNGEFEPLNNNKYSSAMIKPLILSNAIYISKVNQKEIKNQEIIEILKLY